MELKLGDIGYMGGPVFIIVQGEQVQKSELGRTQNIACPRCGIKIFFDRGADSEEILEFHSSTCPSHTNTETSVELEEYFY